MKHGPGMCELWDCVKKVAYFFNTPYICFYQGDTASLERQVVDSYETKIAANKVNNIYKKLNA